MRHLLASAAAAALVFPVAVQAQPAGGQTQPAASSPAKTSGAATNTSRANVEQCFGDMQAYNKSMAERPSGYGAAGYAYGNALSSRETAQIREAARTFANNGNVEACRVVLAELKKTHGVGVSAWRTMQEADRNRMAESFRGGIKAAKPATEVGALRANLVIGADVRNPRGDDLGDVQDIMLGPDGKVEYLLIEHGGFLGMGEEWTPLRWKDVRIAPDFETVVVNATAEALDDAPTVNSREWTQNRDKWRREADTYWDKALQG